MGAIMSNNNNKNLKPLIEYSNYKKAIRFANVEYRAKLEGYAQIIQNHIANEVQHREEERQRKREQREQEKRAEAERQEQQKSGNQQRQWQQQGLCTNCGGQFGGVFTKKCKSCGRAQ